MTRGFLTLAAAAIALVSAPAGHAAGGSYVFDGGTKQQQAQVRKALGASSFDWGVVPGRIVIHIERGLSSAAAPGEIWLDGDLLDAGMFSWGVVQHEYAHEVDFLLLNDEERSMLLELLGGQRWCSTTPTIRHEELGCERFASTLAWAYWPSPDNCMRPEGRRDESAALPAREFRALVARLIPSLGRPEVGR